MLRSFPKQLKEFFPDLISSPQAAALATFSQVQKYAGLEHWPCKLEIQEEDLNPIVAPTVVIQNSEQNPLGTFSLDEDSEITITYNPRIVTNPTQMIATFAHELTHYLTGTAPKPPPGGWENWECATDIGATFLGFGFFIANAAFNFQQYTNVDSQGWQISGSGYLTETEYSYSLAIFLLLKEIDPKVAYPFCDVNIKSFLKKAIVELEDSQYINELKMIKLLS